MNTALRKSGVNVLGDMPWGSHVCMFYELKEDLLDTVGPYFKAGLESNEFCLWAPSEPVTVEEAHLALSRRIPDFIATWRPATWKSFRGASGISKEIGSAAQELSEVLGREIARRVGQRL